MIGVSDVVWCPLSGVNDLVCLEWAGVVRDGILWCGMM